ncbi:MAG: RNA polymerase sigma factor [Gaiellaceae bacterium]
MGVPPRDPRVAEARLEALFRRHYRDVAVYVRRRAEPDLVDDVVAETFLVAWRRLEEVPINARPWLIGVARKTLSTQRRSTGRRRSLVTRLEAAQRSAEQSDQSTELGVAEALMRLSAKDREAITLVAWEGLTPSEAALVIGQSSIAFRVRLHRAKARLREQLDTQGAPTAPPTLSSREIRLTGGGPER